MKEHSIDCHPSSYKTGRGLLGFKVQSPGLRADFPLYVFVKFMVSLRLQLRALAFLWSLGLEPSETCLVLAHGVMGLEGSVRACGGEARL